MNKIKEIKECIQQEVLSAITKATRDNELPDLRPPTFSVDAPRDKNHGDFAVNAAMIMSKPAGLSPRMIAQTIVDHIDPSPAWLDKVEIAGPGFLNFHLLDRKSVV